MGAFLAMVKKNLIVLSRYPVSFITSFAMVFIFMLLFIFAIAMFTPPSGEWDNGLHISDNPLLMAEKDGNDIYLGFQAYTDNNSELYVLNCSYSPGNYTYSDVSSRYENGTWFIEMVINNRTNEIYLGFRNSTYNQNWGINPPELPSGKANVDGYIHTESKNISFAGIAFYGFIFFMFLQDIVWFIGYSLREEQYQGTLESLYLTPANKFSNLVSRVFLNVVWTGLNVIAALLIVVFLFGALPASNVAFALLVLFLSLMQMFGMGFIFAAFTLRAKGSADFIMNFVAIIFTFTCAMFFPFSALPKAMVEYISKWIPLSYSVDLFRSALLSYPPGFPELASIPFELSITIIFAFLMPAIGYFLYWKIERSARMKGTLGEY